MKKTKERKVNMKQSKGITIVALVVTIIVLIILAGVSINLLFGHNGIINRAKQAKNEYSISELKEKIEMEIAKLYTDYITSNRTLTIETALTELLDAKILDSIEDDGIGYIDKYEVKLRYDESNYIEIEYIEVATGIRIKYDLNPSGYTNNNVQIKFKAQGDIKKVVCQDGTVIEAQDGVVETNYTVTANGKYKFIVEDIEGNIKEREVEVNTIDTKEPNDFTITAENTGEGFIITGLAEDAEATNSSVKSGIEKYEYYIKKSTESNFVKYDSNEINGLENGTYQLYAIAYDKAGNTKQTSTITAEVKLVIKFKEIATGYYHSLGIDLDGNIWAWGYDSNGRLGTGTNTGNKCSTPQKIQIEETFEKVDLGAGSFSVALDKDGNIWTWGDNTYYQLGDGTTTTRYSPVQVTTNKKFIEISAGQDHVLAIDEDGNIWAWGRNTWGRLGTGSTSAKTVPTQITQNTRYIKVAAGTTHSVAIDEDGNIWGWGCNDSGQVGKADIGDRSYVPVKIELNFKFKEISSYYNHSIAIDINGNIWAWGYNANGELGDETTTNQFTPIKITDNQQFIKVSAGRKHNTAIDINGNMWSWGVNGDGQLGNGTSTKIAIPTMTNQGKYTKISSGAYHTIVINEKNIASSTGYNYNGQLGDGTTSTRYSLVQIP